MIDLFIGLSGRNYPKTWSTRETAPKPARGGIGWHPEPPDPGSGGTGRVLWWLRWDLRDWALGGNGGRDVGPPAWGRTHGNRRNERGSALIFALMVVFILSIGTTVLWRQLHSNLDQQRRSWHREQAFQLAEAGLEQAIATLRTGTGAYAGETDVPLGAGSFSVTVSGGAGTGEYLLESWGRLDGAAYRHDRAGLRARLRLGPGGRLMAYAFEPIRGDRS